MTNAYESLSGELKRSPKRWCVTGAAGFIGSHIVETLLQLGQEVTGLDNFSTGSKENLDIVRANVGDAAAKRFTFIEGDIRDLDTCRKAVSGADYILHQAALASVPRSIDDPISSAQVNVDGFVNMSVAARDAKVKRFVYASSSSVYGDSEALPKFEDQVGQLLSPYALTKWANELYAGVFSKVYGLEFIGLRYFNVFGPRQSLDGPYAAVLPCWVRALSAGKSCEIYGDGETSRDFCFVTNAVQANILAACVANKEAVGKAYNVAVGDRTTLNQLYTLLVSELGAATGKKYPEKPVYQPFRQGDIRHSHASVDRAKALLGYAPPVKIAEGIKRYVQWISR